MQQLAADAALRHGKPRKILAYVDVFDRPSIDAVLSGVGYVSRTAADVIKASTEALAAGDVPAELVATWQAESERAHARAAKTSAAAEKDFWTDRAKVLDVAVEKKGGCCVTSVTFSRP